MHKGEIISNMLMILPNPQRHVVPVVVLTQSKPLPIPAVRSVTIAVPKTSVTRPIQAKTVVTKTNLPHRRHINRSPSLKASNFTPKFTDIKAPMVNAAQGNPQYALKDKGVIESGCSRHMKGNMSSVSDFEELNGGYVAFGGNPKGGKISRKGCGLIWLFDIDTLTKTMNYQPVTTGNQSNPSAGIQDKFDVEKEGEEKPEFEGRKPEFEVNVSPSSSAQSKKLDDKTKREAKGKSLVES
nr:ribonuclease H-like domain-containing protein [Tanacetum cinerariifolium]